MLAFVIADDLTGAMDTGVAFAQCGLRTAVCTGCDIPDDIWKTENETKVPFSPDVLCVNAGSRHLPPSQAYEIVFRLAKSASRQHIPCIYKKTDSALRGNVGAELAAMKDALGMEVLPFVPAYPALGRTIKNGMLYINGVPAALTTLGQDPFNPLPSSSVIEILKSTAPDITAFSKSTAASENTPVSENNAVSENIANTAVSENMPACKGIQVYDSVTDDDLSRAASLLSDAALRSAGCGGFAKVLAGKLRTALPSDLQRTADELSDEFVTDEMRAMESGRSDGHGFLVVCGSLHETSLLQVRTAVAEGVPGHILPQEISSGKSQLPQTDAPAKSQEFMPSIASSATLVRDLAGELDHPGISILCTSDYTAASEIPGSHASPEMSAFCIASCLGQIVRELATAGRIATLCVFGGDTLSAIMQSLEVSMIDIERELYPGIVRGQIRFRGQRICLISKAGSFGDPALIQNLRNGTGEQSARPLFQTIKKKDDVLVPLSTTSV